MPLPVESERAASAARWGNRRVALVRSHPGDDAEMPCLPGRIRRGGHRHWHLLPDRNLPAHHNDSGMHGFDGLFSRQKL